MWQAKRGSNPQPAVLETAALPIELLACKNGRKRLRNLSLCVIFPSKIRRLAGSLRMSVRAASRRFAHLLSR